MDAFERQLRDQLHALVADTDPDPALRGRIAAGIRTRRRRPPVLAVAAATLVLVAVTTIVAAGRDDGAADLAVASDTATDATTSTTAGSSTTTTEALDPAPPARATPVPGVTTTTTDTTLPVPVASPPTTLALVCRNSLDPACGAFRWEPAPVNRPATVTAWIEGEARVGAFVEVHFSIDDPDGPVDAGRNVVRLDRRGISLGADSITNEPCPLRYGPWTPPAPAGGRDESRVSVVFDETGPYVVTVEITAAQGCDNVSPYRSGGTTSFTVEVLPADA